MTADFTGEAVSRALNVLAGATLLVGIDDTDTLETPGTNKLAMRLTAELTDDLEASLITRHQLLIDPRVPYTKKNGSAAIRFVARRATDVESLIERLRGSIVRWSPPGSDPGLCVVLGEPPPPVTTLGVDCQRRVLTQAEAMSVATGAGIHLEGLGGTRDGLIGALAAVGLHAGGDDGRVVHAGGRRGGLCELTGEWEVPELIERGLDEVRELASGRRIVRGRIELGKRLRANYRGGRVVLFVAATCICSLWNAVRVP